jgi:hypothetical protein
MLLDVVIELELCRMWSKADIVDLLRPLPANPHIDEILCEDATLG